MSDGQTAFASRNRPKGNPSRFEVVRKAIDVGPRIVFGHLEQLGIHALISPFTVFLVFVFLLVPFAVLGLWRGGCIWFQGARDGVGGLVGLYHGSVCGDAAWGEIAGTIVIVVVVVIVVERKVSKSIELSG